MGPAQQVCIDPCVTPISYHQGQHCRYLSEVLLVIAFLLQGQAPVAYALSIVT
jgi:hypothetical protein